MNYIKENGIIIILTEEEKLKKEEDAIEDRKIIRTDKVLHLKNCFNNNNLKVEDIIFIGSDQGDYGCTYEELIKLFESMDSDVQIRHDLVIVFKNKSWLFRHEYDGDYSWELNYYPVIPSSYKQLDGSSIVLDYNRY